MGGFVASVRMEFGLFNQAVAFVIEILDRNILPHEASEDAIAICVILMSGFVS